MALVYLLYLATVNCFWHYAKCVYWLQLLFISATSAPRGDGNDYLGRQLRVFRKRRRMEVIRNSNWLQYVSLCSHVTYACNGNFIQCLQRSLIRTYTNKDTCSVCILLCQDIFAYISLRNKHLRKFAHAYNVCAHSYVREYVRWCVYVNACERVCEHTYVYAHVYV